MIIPSFTGFASTPNTAQAYLGGIASRQKDRQLSLEEQQMANQALAANQAMQQKQQALEMEQQQAAMKAKVEQEQIQSRAMIQQQQVNIRQQYETQKTAVEAGKLQTAQETLKFKVAEASQKFHAMENYGLTRAELIKGGMSEADASAQAMRQWGPQMGQAGAGMSSVMRPQATLPTEMQEKRVEQADRRLNLQEQALEQKGVQGDRRLDISEKVAASKETQAKIKSLSDIQEKDWKGALDAIKVAKGEKVTAEERASAKEYAQRQDTLNKLVGGGKKATTSEAAPNEVLKYKDGKPYGYYDKETGEPIRLYAE